jgi:hypothetical protein
MGDIDIKMIESMVWSEDQAREDEMLGRQQKGLLYYYELNALFEKLQEKGVNFYFVRFNIQGTDERRNLVDPKWYEFGGTKNFEKFRHNSSFPWRWKEERKYEEFKDQKDRHKSFCSGTGEKKYENYKHMARVREELFGVPPGEESVFEKLPFLKKEMAMTREELEDTFVKRAHLEKQYLEEREIDFWFKRMGELMGERIPNVELCYVNKRSVDLPYLIGQFELEMIVGVKGLLPGIGESIFCSFKRWLMMYLLISENVTVSKDMTIEERCKLRMGNGIYFEYLKNIDEIKKKITNEEFLLWRNPRFHSIYRYKNKNQRKSTFEDEFRLFFYLTTYGNMSLLSKEWNENKVISRRCKILKTKLEARQEGGGNPLLFVLDLYMQLNNLYYNNNYIYKKVEGSKYSFVEHSDNIFSFGENIKEMFLSLLKDEVCRFHFRVVNIDQLIVENLQWYYDFVLKYPKNYLRKVEFNENVIEYVNGLYFKDKDEFYDFKRNRKELNKMVKNKISLFSKIPFEKKVYEV